MKLENEITHKKSSSIGFAWAITWRVLIITFGLEWLFNQVPLPEESLSLWVTIALQILVSLALYWAAIHWVLQRGFGSVKIVLMEHAHYQKLVSKLNDNE